MSKITGFIIGLFSPLVFVSPAFAANVQVCPTDQFNPLCNLNFDNIGGIIGKIIVLLLIVAVVVSLFFLIYGGIKWIISGGDKTAVEGARNHIVAAIVGLMIALLSFFVLNFVGRFFGVDLSNLNIPTLP
ncbi:MAG: hypothetical protein ABH816_01275 [Candidatus Levyibacteriota bacterium]